jgi:hypothetical protein
MKSSLKTLVEEIFSDARELCLCVVFEAEAVSNVAVAETFATFDEVPAEYLSPSPAIEFAVATDSDD